VVKNEVRRAKEEERIEGSLPDYWREESKIRREG